MSGFTAEDIRHLPHDAPPLPAWVSDFAGPPSVLVGAQFAAAAEMTTAAFEAGVTEAYRSVFRQLEAHPSLRPARFWAFIPNIHQDLGGGLDRYKAFNTARYGAFAAHFGQTTFLGGSIPTASAVGIDGQRFQLHCLATADIGVPVENPRQVPAYQYSRRFGPLPPCFARATLLAADRDRPVLLVGGTASIVGEDSAHGEDFSRQAQETLLNLASLVASAEGRPVPTASTELRPLLARYDEIRIYCPRPEVQREIVDLVAANFSGACRVEMVRASLCRAELLIEIEGLARPIRVPGRA
ncbi:MAG: hypothetical protein ABI880_00970 [Acidobacteriota bacterium]